MKQLNPLDTPENIRQLSHTDPQPENPRYRLDHVSGEALLRQLKGLVGRSNRDTASILAHLAEVEARGIHRESACASLYTYCIYELRFSEDEAQRRIRAARLARRFPVLFEMLEDASIHLTGILLLAPHLTLENQAELLARARYRTKKEIEELIREICPRPDVPGRIVPLGPALARVGRIRNGTYREVVRALAGPVRKLEASNERCGAPVAPDDEAPDDEADDGAPIESLAGSTAPSNALTESSSSPDEERKAQAPSSSPSPSPRRYHIEFTADQSYVELLEQARDLLQHQIPTRDIAEVQRLAIQALVDQLEKRKLKATDRPRRKRPVPRPSPSDARRRSSRHLPAALTREVWQRDGGRCTYVDRRGQRCRETAGLEFHHRHAHRRGGPATSDNIYLMCRLCRMRHNLHLGYPFNRRSSAGPVSTADPRERGRGLAGARASAAAWAASFQAAA